MLLLNNQKIKTTNVESTIHQGMLISFCLPLTASFSKQRLSRNGKHRFLKKLEPLALFISSLVVEAEHKKQQGLSKDPRIAINPSRPP
jgi:hypothetical protein